MIDLPESVTGLSLKHGFKRSAGYNQGWMFDNSMGPNPLWLIEWLTRDMKITEDMVVLDMGCGKAITSLFLAQEFGCTVFANDLWISPEENLKRIAEYRLNQKVFPIQAEAHALPYARGQFGAIVCIDAYQYFGTDDLYLKYFSGFLKPGGQIGIVVPGWSKSLEVQDFCKSDRFDSSDFTCFHTLEWWRRHWRRSGMVKLNKTGYLPNAKEIWRDSTLAMYHTKKLLRQAENISPEEIQKELDFWKDDIDFLEQDKNDVVSILRLIGQKK
ncbi:MAG TPA: methyltransferase domain-containing protein [Dehalococcoidales bacterium]|nr:methyltransferase domain-containing protein [Dehalococcoidales bacterium]